MTGLRRTMGFVFALAALHAPLRACTFDEAQDTFNQGVELWQRGHEKEALALFNKVLAMSPSQASAYAIWRDTDYSVWRELLTSGGEAELVAKRLIELARLERKARANDATAIQAAVGEAMTASEEPAISKAVQKLSAEHGEYAAPYLIGFLGSSMSDHDKTVRAMIILERMNTDVVMPLCTALESEDPVLRRNLCYVLGIIGDRRAAGYLAAHAQSDADAGVKTAAQESLQRAHLPTDALASFLALGDAYHHRQIREQDYSDVAWSWKADRLVATPIPRPIYNDEMAKAAYDHALDVDPTSTAALAGLARSYVAQSTKLELMEKAGKDLGEWKSRVDEARLAVHAAGVPALDLALDWSVKNGDGSAGSALCRVLSSLAQQPTPSLNSALSSSDGALRSEAAVALATIGLRTGQAPSPEVVSLLGEAVGREVARLAVIIDPDAPRGAALQAALEKQGMFVSRYESGVKALVLIRRAAGVDVVLAADKQKDATLSEIIDELKADERLAGVPIVCITASAEEAAGIYGERIAGTVAGAEQLEAVQQALSKGLGGDRALADDLAHRAGLVLAHLAHGSGHGAHADLSGVVAPVQSALVNRPDEVVVPALMTLAGIGGAAQAAPVLDVLGDEKRSEPVRVAAADCLAGILARDSAAVGPEGAARLQAVASSGAAVSIRDASARALGLIQMDAAQRIELLRKLRQPAPAPAGS